MTGTLKITCTAADNVNVAFYQNAVPIIRDLAVENGLGRDLTEISVQLTAEPPFLTPGIWRIAEDQTVQCSACWGDLRSHSYPNRQR